MTALLLADNLVRLAHPELTSELSARSRGRLLGAGALFKTMASPATPAAAPADTADAVAEAQLIVVKAVRGLLKSADQPMFCGGDLLPALNAAVRGLVERAAYRAAAGGRKTVHAWDL